MALKDYQEKLRELLEDTIKSETKIEWSSRINPNSYAPRLDVAVGPFSIENGTEFIDEYNQLFDNNISIIKEMAKLHLLNLGYITNKISLEETNNQIQYKVDELK